MGYRNRDILFSEDDTCSSSSSPSASLSEALLFATMSIIGLPVDIHIKDGSVFSGIFHAASVDGDYGIVLNKARMTKKGKGNTNVREEGLIDTLVIFSSDLVQVVAKGVMLPADGVAGNITGEDEEAVVHNGHCSESVTREVENQDAKQANQSSANQVEAVEHGGINMTLKASSNGLICNSTSASVKADDWCCEKSNSANSAEGVEIVSESHDLPATSVEISAPRSTNSIKSAKEFKLNPAAKIFSPSFLNPTSATSAMPTAANMAYIPNSSPVVSVATIQAEVGFNAFASQPSVPVKAAHYNNLTMGNGGSGSQSSEPQQIVGQLAHRTRPLPYAAHYTPVLSEPAYLQPSSPAVMVGRSGHYVYVHPVSHDLVPAATAISTVSTRPLSNSAQFPKQQGGTVGQAMQLYVPPPVLTSGQQPFALQSQISLLQPGFPVTRPIAIPGPNGFYGTKFS